MAAILSDGLTINFRQTAALKDIDLDIEENEIIGIFGKPGSGKTALLSILSALKYPSSGTITVDNQNPFENSAVTTKICFTWAGGKIRKSGNVRKALKFCSKLRPNWDMEYAYYLLKRFGFEPEMKVKNLTDVGIALLNIVNGLASRAEITIFDGTYTELDDSQKNIFFDEIRKDHRRYPRSIILSGDSPDEVKHLLHDMIILDRGQVIAHAPVEEIVARAQDIMHVAIRPTLKEIIMHFTEGEDHQ